MAKHLASIHGTEEDKVNCPFYFKIGACRHSDRCSRLHHKPAFSQTLLVKHLYQHPVRLAELQQAAGLTVPNNNPNNGANSSNIDPEQALEDFLCFFEDIYMEFSKFGRLEALHVVDNLGDHMIGHVYVKFFDEEQASDALQVMNGRYYDGRMMTVEFSPVTDFREARCRDFDEDACARGGFCNFLHVKPVPNCLIRSLEEEAEEDRREQEQRELRDKENQRREKERDRERHRQKKRKREKDESSSGRKSRRDRDKHHHSSHRSSRSSKNENDASDYSDNNDSDRDDNQKDKDGDNSSSRRRRHRKSRHSRSSSNDSRSRSPPIKRED